MSALSRYSNIWRIDPASEAAGYRSYSVPIAKEFIKNLGVFQGKDLQTTLLSYFYGQNETVDIVTRAKAGLCLRCYISYPILKVCKKIDYLFSGGKQFTYRDLLPFVLDDDGKSLIFIDRDTKQQFFIDNDGELKDPTYQFFSTKILQSFRSESKSRMSLDNWAYLQTKQNPQIKNFISEFGFRHLSDWALLNRVRRKQLENLSVRDRNIVEAFHMVYRRDRVKQRQTGIRKCPDPSREQLQEMLMYLKDKESHIYTTKDLILSLNQIAIQLRQYDIWNSREPLEIYNPEIQIYTARTDLPGSSLDLEEEEDKEFMGFLHKQLNLALSNAIKQEINNRISQLQKSKKYAIFANQYLQGLKLYYCHNLSLREIAPKLNMKSWDRARRVLNPGKLLSDVRSFTIQEIISEILHKVKEKKFPMSLSSPEYLKNLAIEVECFADTEIFKEAAEEIRAGKNRTMNSLYAQQLRIYLKKNN
ncbi:hypothetical protein [Mastigocoleus sp. MO_188.B34]|uniref:hypothetical protein n=1 Tax=Mastigocoleus sp. MO_188.B34 TaxID=3036635 RepID=UPI0026086AD8|nr:hypothetical protein [Mastigocoleus sp. MO_188.B34]MDJ0694849.1 hypothetical protein [Mastigocoleus sp. MO_188.B34]